MSDVKIYPQPREGIVGEARDDDLLSLDESALPRRKIMLAMARSLWSMALAAHRAPDGVAMWQRMDKPQPGDLVVENTRTDPVQGLGILLARRKEWACTDAEWEQWQAEDPGGYDRRPIDDVWYVQYGPQPEDVCRWSNSSFIAVPTERNWARSTPNDM